MHDKHGRLLSVGAIVSLACRITSTCAESQLCNITVESLEPNSAGYPETFTSDAKVFELAAVPAPILDEVEYVARLCHELNRAYCQNIGDNSQFPWETAPAWQRNSTRLGVVFAIDHPDAPASAQHDSWCLAKVKDGWVGGPVKDAEAKTHPCLVPYEDLPAAQQIKDQLFRAVVAVMVQRGPHNLVRVPADVLERAKSALEHRIKDATKGAEEAEARRNAGIAELLRDGITNDLKAIVQINTVLEAFPSDPPPVTPPPPTQAEAEAVGAASA